MVEPVDPVAKLRDIFEKKARLALDADIDAKAVGAVENGADRLRELLRRPRTGGIPPSIRPLVMLMLVAPRSRANWSVVRIIAVRSARCRGLGLMRLGSKYGSRRGVFPVAKRTIAIDVAHLQIERFRVLTTWVVRADVISGG